MCVLRPSERRCVTKVVLQLIERFYIPQCANYQQFEEICETLQQKCGALLDPCEKLFMEAQFLVRTPNASENEMSFAVEKLQLLFGETNASQVDTFIRRIEQVLLPENPARAIEVFLKGGSYIHLARCSDGLACTKLRQLDNQKAARASLVTAARAIIEKAIDSPSAVALLQKFCDLASKPSVFDLFNWLISTHREDLLIQLNHKELEQFLLHQDFFTLYRLYVSRKEIRKAIVLLYKVAVLSHDTNIELTKRIEALNLCIELFNQVDLSLEPLPYPELTLSNLRRHLNYLLVCYETGLDSVDLAHCSELIRYCRERHFYDLVLFIMLLQNDNDADAVESAWRDFMNACFGTHSVDDSVNRIIETIVRLADESMIPLTVILERVLTAGYQHAEKIIQVSGCSTTFVIGQLTQLLWLHQEENWRLEVAALVLKWECGVGLMGRVYSPPMRSLLQVIEGDLAMILEHQEAARRLIEQIHSLLWPVFSKH